MIGRRAALWALGIIAVVNAAGQSLNPPRGDDLVYIRWAAERAWDPWTPMFRPAPFPGWRPATNLAWWLSVSLDGALAILPQISLAALWLLACFGAYKWVDARWGGRPALAALALLLATDRFRDLVIWRSWVNITGELAGISLCLWAMERGNGARAIMTGAVACWFKETATFPLVAAALLIYQRPAVALGIFVAGLPGATKSALDAGLFANRASYPIPSFENLWFYARTIIGWVWPASILLAAFWDRARSVANEARWVAPIALAIAPALLYPHRNPTYILEAMLFAVGPASVVLVNTRSRAFFSLTLALSLWSVPSSLLDIRWQVRQLFQQVPTIRSVNPNVVQSFAVAPEASDAAIWLALYLKFNHGIPETREHPAGIEPLPGITLKLSPVLTSPPAASSTTPTAPQ